MQLICVHTKPPHHTSGRDGAASKDISSDQFIEESVGHSIL